MIRVMQNEAGVVKQVKEGFSWTLFFFGFFVPLIRGDLKWFFIMLILHLLTDVLSWLVLPFVYNRIYIDALLEEGYRFIS